MRLSTIKHMLMNPAAQLELKMRNLSVLLPEDVLIEILVNLPVKSLVRFRSISNYWGTFLKSHAFVTKHHKRDNSKEILLLNRYLYPQESQELHDQGGKSLFSLHDLDSPERLVSPNISMPFVKDKSSYVDLVASCNGLLCLRTDLENIVLYNPTMREFEFLPQSPIACPDSYFACYSGLGFGVDASSNTYKFVQILDVQELFMEDSSDQDTYIRIDLYDFRTNFWRMIDDAKVPGVGLDPRYQIFYNGCFHWSTDRYTYWNRNEYSSILSFDFSTETFQEFEFPPCCVDPHSSSLIIINQHLALVPYEAMMDEPLMLDIWVMKEYGVKESWIKELVIGPYLCRFIFFTWKNEWLVVQTKDNKLAYCGLHANKIRTHAIESLGDSMMRALLFEESLISLKHKI